MKIVASLLLACLTATPTLAQKPERPFRVFVGVLDVLKVGTGPVLGRDTYSQYGLSYDLKTASMGSKTVSYGLFYDYATGKDTGTWKSYGYDVFIRGGGVQARVTLSDASGAGQPSLGLGIGSYGVGSVTGDGRGPFGVSTATDVGAKLTLGYELKSGVLAEVGYLRLGTRDLLQYRVGYRF
ncbi:hypothetical protein [Armatimonas rosea]|uniref:Outer membrane protein beta-barrel domain-containing protein n=1 Tax=Armatimonas rosea TaxID=685828 RepID=A0A7W9SVK9_ARMRO|nr:hypothetical protein [Armatimonas rosea]MBB6052974.1 hypothetical protein [Armatimonas rosea]